MDSVERWLETGIGIKVLHPSYTSFDENVDSLSVALPGFYVNGIYNHVGAFKLLADCIAGRSEEAWRTLENLIPDSKSIPRSEDNASTSP